MIKNAVLILLLLLGYGNLALGQNVKNDAKSDKPISPTPTVTQPAGEATPAITPTPTAKTGIKDGVTEQEIDDLINGLSTDNQMDIIDARNELIEIGKPAVPALLAALDKSKYETKFLICEILGGIRDERAVQPLVKLLQEKDEHAASIASAAARSLRSFADNSVIPFLMKTVTSADVALRYESIKSLGILRAQQAIPLIRDYITDTNKTPLGYLVEAAAVEALGRLKDRSAAQRLIALLRNHDVEQASDEPLAGYAIKALERITNYQGMTFSRIDDDKKKEQVIKGWEDWWEKNRKDYEQ